MAGLHIDASVPRATLFSLLTPPAPLVSFQKTVVLGRFAQKYENPAPINYTKLSNFVAEVEPAGNAS